MSISDAADGRSGRGVKAWASARGVLLPALLLLALVMVGCGAREASREADSSTAAPHSSVPAAVSEAESAVVKLRVLSPADYDEFLSQHRGKVVLVDFWATWCAVCVEGLPHTLELQRKYGDRGLVVATVAMEDGENQSAAESLLGKAGGAGTHFLSSLGTDPQGAQAFGIERGTIPAIKVFDRSGQLDRTFGDGDLIPHAEVEQRVAELLRK